MKRIALFVFILVVTVNTVVTMDQEGSYNYHFERIFSSRENYIKVPRVFEEIFASKTKHGDSIQDNLNLGSEGGLLPLHIAIDEKNHQVILELLKNGANVHLRTKNMPSPLEYAEHKYFSEKNEENKKIAILLLAGSLGYYESFEGVYSVLYASEQK